MAQSNSSRLGFPALTTALYIARGVVPDSLTLESLSLAINLAYIQKKNCWNPDDPMITFLGTLRRFCSFLFYPCSSFYISTSSTSTLRPLCSEHRRLGADAAEPSPWLMPGDAEYSRLGSASAHHQHGGFHGPGGLARSPSFSFGGR